MFGISEVELRALPEEAFLDRYLRMLAPLVQVAATQGFRSGWRPPQSDDLASFAARSTRFEATDDSTCEPAAQDRSRRPYPQPHLRLSEKS